MCFFGPIRYLCIFSSSLQCRKKHLNFVTRSFRVKVTNVSDFVITQVGEWMMSRSSYVVMCARRLEEFYIRQRARPDSSGFELQIRTEHPFRSTQRASDYLPICTTRKM